MTKLTIYNYHLCGIPFIFDDSSKQIIIESGKYITVDKDTTVNYYIPIKMNGNCQTILDNSVTNVWSDPIPIGNTTTIVIGVLYDGNIYGMTNNGCVDLGMTVPPSTTNQLKGISCTETLSIKCNVDPTTFKYPVIGGSGNIYVSNNWILWIFIIIFIIFIIVVIVFVYKKKNSGKQNV